MILAGRIGRRLKSTGQVLVTAESCTGGWVAQQVTSIAGSSDWFERGYVTYSNVAKQQLLGVKRRTLKRFGAVSEPTAREMARGALRRSRGSIALAVTGVAGPSGGTREKPVGTVCFAWAHGRKLRSETKHFRGSRTSVRRKSVEYGLRGLFRWL